VKPHTFFQYTTLPKKYLLTDETEDNPYHLFFWMVARLKFIDTGGNVIYTYPNKRNTYLCEAALAALPRRFIREQTTPDGYEYVPLPALIWKDTLTQEPWMYEYVRSLYTPLWEKYPQQKGKYSYISRKSSLNRRTVLNEDELRPLLKWLGFSIYYMEELTFTEQIALFASSEILLSPHGAALSFAIFCQADSVVVEILNPSPSILFYKDLCEKCSLHWIAFSTIEIRGENYTVDCESLKILLHHIISLR
jgi:hypothetical protein